MSITDSEMTTLRALSNDLAAAVERAGAATVAVHARNRVASSGVHWRPGVIVTADHTVEHEDNITVTLADGTSVPATLAGRDPNTDLAVLRLGGDATATVAQLGDAAALKVGHLALALGRTDGSGVAASLGAISAVGGGWSTGRGGQIDQFIRADVTYYPGFSGGPLVDAAGQVVGINTSGLSRSMGLTIPVATVNRVVDALLTKGRIARGYFGVSLQPVRLPDSLKAALGTDAGAGLIAVSVEEGGPAAHAGMMIGDILVSVGGQNVEDTDAVQAFLAPDKVGTQVTARVARGGAATDLMITVGERPQTATAGEHSQKGR